MPRMFTVQSYLLGCLYKRQSYLLCHFLQSWMNMINGIHDGRDHTATRVGSGSSYYDHICMPNGCYSII